MNRSFFHTNDLRKISISNFSIKVKTNPIINIDNFIISVQNKERKKEIDLNYNDASHIIEGNMLIFCTRGEAKFKINLVEHHIEKNSLLMVIPNSILELVEQSEDFEIEFVFYTFDFISNLKLKEGLGSEMKNIEENPHLFLSKNDFEDFLFIHKMMVKQCLHKNIYQDELVKSYLLTILYRISQIYKVDNDLNSVRNLGREDIIYKKFISLLFKHYREERSIQFYADKLHLTPKYFSKIIKKVSQISAKERIEEMVIMAAKALLKGSDLTIIQISEELNFATPSFFITYFKSKIGMTPKYYRDNFL